MAKRKGAHSHYEKMFETVLRNSQILYIAINEAKRPIFQNNKIKNFDFIIFSKNGIFLIDIKGKQFPYEHKKSKNYWENWITKDDISGLQTWSKKMNFKGIILFPYFIKYNKDTKYFKDIIIYKRRKYGLVAIDAFDYLKNCKIRSKEFNAIYISRKRFKTLVKPLSYFIPEIITD